MDRRCLSVIASTSSLICQGEGSASFRIWEVVPDAASDLWWQAEVLEIRATPTSVRANLPQPTSFTAHPSGSRLRNPRRWANAGKNILPTIVGGEFLLFVHSILVDGTG